MNPAAMTTTTITGLVALSLHHRAALCPQPLHIQKKPRKLSFRRTLLRKSSHSPTYGEEVYGPLDDIIDEITGDIWRSPPLFTLDPSLLAVVNPLKAAATWTVTPLPVSRIPSDVPLTIRKQRNSRSTASSSSYSDAMSSSRKISQDQPDGYPDVNLPFVAQADSWPLLQSAGTQMAFSERPESCSKPTVYTEQLPTTQKIKSRLRKLTNTLPPLLRRGTSNGSQSNGSASNSVAASNTGSPTEMILVSPEGMDDGFPGWISRNAASASMFTELAAFMSPPPEPHREQSETVRPSSDSRGLPTTLNAVVRVLPEVKVLKMEDNQDFWIAVEVEGVLHNRRALHNPSLDIVILIDNGYYVSKDCLNQAVELAIGALNLLGNFDRTSLYTTHCTHETVSGNVPELLFPLRPLSKESKVELQEMIRNIKHHGAQKWSPPRPNPYMADVLIAVAKSLENRKPKSGSTHIMLFSPAVSNVHGVAKAHPGLYVHQINPASIPIHCYQNPEFAMCNEDCCAKFSAHNSSHYESIPGLVKQIIRYARSEPPIDEATDFDIEIRTKNGCMVLQEEGTRLIRRLRPGQVHSFFLRIRVHRSQTQELNLDTKNPILQSCLNNNNMRQDLQNAQAMGASKVHLMSFQVMYKDSLDEATCWRYSESHLFVFKDLGNLYCPPDVSADLYKRFFFYMMSRLDTSEAGTAMKQLEGQVNNMTSALQKNVERLKKEVAYHVEVADYERNSRKSLPYYLGPVHVPDPHEWVVARWNLTREKEQQAIGTK